MHFLGRFEIELVGFIAHAVGLRDNFARADAEQHVMGNAVFTAQIMRIVGADQRDSRFLRYFDDGGIDALLRGKIVILQFEIKIARTENIAQVPSLPPAPHPAVP